MRRYQIVLTIVGSLAVGVYLLWPSLMRVVVQEALRSAQREGARISWEGLTVSGFTVSVESLGLWLPGPPLRGGFRPPIKIDLERSQAQLRPSSLLAFNPSVDFTLRAYGGSIDGTVTGLRTSPRVSARFQDVDLAKHDQLRALGLSSALVSGSLTEFEQVSKDAIRGSFDIFIRRIEVPRIPPALSIVKLQPLKDGEIHLRGMIDPDNVNLDEVKIASSYGSAQGACRAINLLQQGNESADGEFQVTIGDALHPEISPFLPMLSNKVLQSETRRFTAKMKGMSCSRSQRSLGDLALGALCVRFMPVKEAPYSSRHLLPP